MACNQRRLIGFISLLDDFIDGRFRGPGQQGRGIGRKLIALALGWKGQLSLEVYVRNRQAVRFYAGLGFTEVSLRLVHDDGFPFENPRLQLGG